MSEKHPLKRERSERWKAARQTYDRACARQTRVPDMNVARAFANLMRVEAEEEQISRSLRGQRREWC